MIQDIPAIIQTITDKIVSEYQPEKIILFGSYAKGTPRELSDIDLFIVKKSDKRRIDRQRELRSKLIGNKFPPIDLIIYTPEEVERRVRIGDFFITKEIFGQGKMLYAN